MKIHNLVSGQLLKNVWPWWVLHLGPWYGHVILVSGCLVLTAVTWPWNGSAIWTLTKANVQPRSIIWSTASNRHHVLGRQTNIRSCHAPPSNCCKPQWSRVSPCISIVYAYGALDCSPLGQRRSTINGQQGIWCQPCNRLAGGSIEILLATSC